MERSAERFFLQRGQTLHLHADQAASIVVASGSLRLAEPPQWLGEQWVAPSIPLAEGQCHPVGAGGGIGGWICLTALTPAEIIALPRRRRLPAWPDLRRLLPALGRWRRSMHGRRA